MTSVSGCFGSGPSYEQLDTVEEVSTVVDKLQDTTDPVGAATTGEEYLLTMQQLASVAAEYARRIRLLTWAVVAIVVYLVLKEAKQ